MNLFIVSLFYKTALSEVDQYLADHNVFLQKYYENGTFICSGPKVPRNGGIILCKSDSYEAVAAIVENDPFKINHVAEYEIIQFRVADHVNGFELLI